jgi:protein-L-isoaspartate(D-aspartate) O-methyltransferase
MAKSLPFVPGRRKLLRAAPTAVLPMLLPGLLAALPPRRVAAAGRAPDTRDFRAERAALAASIARDAERNSALLGIERLDESVLDAIRQVPRELFVPAPLRDLAYIDQPLPIGHGQTISQPFIVALMTQLSGAGPGRRIYELGTGSGYQAAVLGAMGAEVYSVEIVPELAARAAEVLDTLDYDKVHVRAGDGYLGWPSAAPFDAIVVTAAHPRIPQPLVDQLEVGGRLVMPIGESDGVQQLALLTKQADGSLSRRDVIPVRFVPVTGDAAGE